MSDAKDPTPDVADSHAPRSFNLVEFSTRRRVTVAMVTITFLLFGLILGIWH